MAVKCSSLVHDSLSSFEPDASTAVYVVVAILGNGGYIPNTTDACCNGNTACSVLFCLSIFSLRSAGGPGSVDPTVLLLPFIAALDRVLIPAARPSVFAIGAALIRFAFRTSWTSV
ncbi:hypothetical protein C8Q70DRAFT_29818 [Cubamyces menziesii]|nr:hypothetical protein C8Q70DRAFT_29818 [Cubamyces menziesii]